MDVQIHTRQPYSNSSDSNYNHKNKKFKRHSHIAGGARESSTSYPILIINMTVTFWEDRERGEKIEKRRGKSLIHCAIRMSPWGNVRNACVKKEVFHRDALLSTDKYESEIWSLWVQYCSAQCPIALVNYSQWTTKMQLNVSIRKALKIQQNSHYICKAIFNDVYTKQTI